MRTGANGSYSFNPPPGPPAFQPLRFSCKKARHPKPSSVRDDTETLLSLRYRKVDNTVTPLFLTHFPVRQLSVSASCVPLSSPHYASLICCFTLVKLELSNASFLPPACQPHVLQSLEPDVSESESLFIRIPSPRVQSERGNLSDSLAI